MVPESDTNAIILNAFHVSLNPARGHIGVAVYDCDDKPLDHASVDTDAEFEIAPYFPNGPVALPTDDPTGTRIFVNVPAGKATVTASLNGLLLARRDVYVRPGSAALVDFRLR